MHYTGKRTSEKNTSRHELKPQWAEKVQGTEGLELSISLSADAPRPRAPGLKFPAMAEIPLQLPRSPFILY